MIKVAINGFGRIGRTSFKIIQDKFADQIEVVGINDLTDSKTLAHLLKYDSNYGIWNHEVSNDEDGIIVDGKHYKVFKEKEPSKLPWGDLGVDVVIESTGRFTDEEGLKQHITAGAKKVVLSAPAKGGNVGTFLIGVNQKDYQSANIINNASCTTNCIAPVVEVLNQKFGILKATMTTIHAYTQDQNLQDGPQSMDIAYNFNDQVTSIRSGGPVTLKASNASTYGYELKAYGAPYTDNTPSLSNQIGNVSFAIDCSK